MLRIHILIMVIQAHETSRIDSYILSTISHGEVARNFLSEIQFTLLHFGAKFLRAKTGFSGKAKV